MEKKIKDLIAQMTLEEKASLCSGGSPWDTKSIERLSIPALRVSDGPHGLRKQEEGSDNLGIMKSIQAVCFPAGCALAASFDREVLKSVGEALGEECQAENVGVLLGPAVNIKRTPLCGRNFEYYSEDPLLSTELAAAYIDGIQSKGVGTCIKHFAANNQETRRFSVSAQMDERTAREIYLASFEGAVKKAKPWTVMAAYNRINGVYAAEHKQYLTDILRKEWGFEGFVMSDWGATNDRVPDLEAGMELEMPPMGNENDERIAEAVKKGELDEAVLDRAVERILRIVFRAQKKHQPGKVFDKERDHRIAKDAALESMVLLKNEGALPLNEKEKVLVIGEFAKKPRFQGGGSSHINVYRLDSAWDCMEQDGVIEKNISFAQGYSLKEEDDDKWRQEALEAAKAADKVVIFAGLPESYESEGYDRTHLRIPENQNRLIEQIAAVHSNVVVVLHNGAPVEMPWIGSVNAVLETYLSGEAVGAAAADILYGRKNPCGRLPETFPIRLQDTPAYPGSFGEGDRAVYREGVFVGYRYYDSREMPVLFPFGHGLSYTEFSFSNLRLDKQELSEDEILTVSVDVTNVGSREGKEVVQLYVKPPISPMAVRPVHELKGFEKVSLLAGETKTVEFTLGKRAFAYFCEEAGDWFVETGNYEIEIGQSSREIVLSGKAKVKGFGCNIRHIDEQTPLGDILRIPGAAEVLQANGVSLEKQECMSDDENEEHILQAHYQYMPIRGRLHQVSEDRRNKILQELRNLL